jgi:DNA processing protein
VSIGQVPYQNYKRFELAIGDRAYPNSLSDLADAPERLYMIGAIELLEQAAIAIVGSRKASPYGLLCAESFARQAACQGLVVVSGGAVGCDQAAHLGALDVAAPSIVVLGCAADVVYPSQAEPLFEKILAAGGLLLSELPWGVNPARWAFVKRNRLIAGLCQATLIIEAGIPSGTFSTADATLSLGRELLVVPGSILSRQSAGCNRLIAQGAWPIISDDSFSEALRQIYNQRPIDLLMGDTHQLKNGSAAVADSQLSLVDLQEASPDQAILERLKVMPARPDELVGICGKDVTQVIRYLSALEFTGQVVRMLDGRFATNLQLRQD